MANQQSTSVRQKPCNLSSADSHFFYLNRHYTHKPLCNFKKYMVVSLKVKLLFSPPNKADTVETHGSTKQKLHPLRENLSLQASFLLAWSYLSLSPSVEGVMLMMSQ